MGTYFGEVTAPNAGGPLMLSVPDDVTKHKWVTGNLKIGAEPRMALTGFKGLYEGGPEFVASGENTRGEGMNTMHLVVSVRGHRLPDGKHVAGTITAVLNGVEQSPWEFTAATSDASDYKRPTPRGGTFSMSPPPSAGAGADDDDEESWLDMIPTPLKFAVPILTAAGGALYFWRKKNP